MKPMYIQVQTDDATGEGYFDIEQFRPIFGTNTDKIRYYEMVPVEGQASLIIKFYDESQSLILPEQ